MNTNVWGPYAWELIHGVTPLLAGKRRAAQAFGVFMEGLSVMLPCRYCRDSIGPFTAHLVEVSGATPEEHALRGTAPEFCWHLHQYVENKLSKQRWQAVAAKLAETLGPDLGITDMSRLTAALDQAAAATGAPLALAKFPSMEVLRKRWDLTEGRPFHASSAWRFLQVTLLQHEMNVPAEASEWIRALSILVSLQPSHQADADAMRSVADWIDAWPSHSHPPDGHPTAFDMAATARVHGALATVGGADESEVSAPFSTAPCDTEAAAGARALFDRVRATSCVIGQCV